jgi:hypothetical protein
MLIAKQQTFIRKFNIFYFFDNTKINIYTYKEIEYTFYKVKFTLLNP